MNYNTTAIASTGNRQVPECNYHITATCTAPAAKNGFRPFQKPDAEEVDKSPAEAI